MMISVRRSAVVVAAAALALTACSSGGKGNGSGSAGKVSPAQSPAQAVETAFHNLGTQSSVRVTMSLAVTASQVQQLSPSATPAEAQALSTGSIFFTVATGHGEALDSPQAAKDKDTSVDLGLKVNGDTPVELIYSGQNLYLRVQLDKLLSDAGQPTAAAQKFNALLGQANNYVPGISDLGAGKWVEIDHAGLVQLAGLIRQYEANLHGGSTTSTTLNSAARNAFLQAEGKVLAALQADSTYTSMGSSGGRTEYTDTLQVANFVNTVIPEIQNVFSSIPGYGSKYSSALQQAQSQIPAGQTASIQLYLSGSKLSEIDFDANQFDHKYKFPVPLRFAFDSPGAPSAPSGATTLDLSKLPGLLQSLGSLGGGSGNSGTTTPTS